MKAGRSNLASITLRLVSYHLCQLLGGGVERYFLRQGDADVSLTRLGPKGINASLAIIAFRGHRTDIRPPEEGHDIGHDLGLKAVGWHGAAKILKARLVRQRGTGRRVTHLRDLEETQQVGYL